MAKQLDLAMPKRGRGRPTPLHEAQIAAWCKAILKINSSLDFEVSSRGWCYLLEEHGLEKTDFKSAEKLINQCRKDGRLPIDICCEDKRRSAENLEWQYPDDDPDTRAEKIVDDVKKWSESYYPYGFWEAQEVYIEMVVEKVDLKNLFSKVCKPFHIALANSGGWWDLNGRVTTMKRFAYWEAKGKKCILLYCGDHDPGGFMISNQLPENLADMSLAAGGWTPGAEKPRSNKYTTHLIECEHLLIDRFGLNKDFIDKHNIPWIRGLVAASGDLRDNQQRYREYVTGYIKNFGARKIEATALVTKPVAAREMCKQAILKYLPKDALPKYYSSVELELPRKEMRTELKRLLSDLIEEFEMDED